MSEALEAAGLRYTWRKDLGGWRRAKPDSPHTALRSESFRGYADHMDTAEFDAALTWLMEQALAGPTAFMCAESVWWRCHRRMIADALLARGWHVRHLLETGRAEPHPLHPNARLEGRRVVYDVDSPEQDPLFP